ncbi:hypothetical protein DFH28DRAFT_1200627 [Melampsora americana]|nr:hypothetical protein DFH28DRAFT_1200627 [Melampsora americana]
MPKVKSSLSKSASAKWNQPSIASRKQWTGFLMSAEVNNQMTIEVRFKIYTPTAVEMNIPSQSPAKVSAGKKPVKSFKLNLINSKKITGKYFEIKSCLVGKSLNEFKKIVADACEDYEAVMKTIVLNLGFLPKLKWKTTVGHSKQVLDLVVQWQAFVTALEKSIKKQGLVVIENENVEVQSIEESMASNFFTSSSSICFVQTLSLNSLFYQQFSRSKLIEQTIGGGGQDSDSKVSNKDAKLHIMANKITRQAGIGEYAGANGTVLSVPWNPTFQYCLTYPAAWIWAKNVPDLKKIKIEDSKCRRARMKKAISMQSLLKRARVMKLTSKTAILIQQRSKKAMTTDKSDGDLEIPTTHHTVKLELFFADCEILYEDDKTCSLLKEAGFLSWTDLRASVQLAEARLPHTCWMKLRLVITLISPPFINSKSSNSM